MKELVENISAYSLLTRNWQDQRELAKKLKTGRIAKVVSRFADLGSALLLPELLESTRKVVIVVPQPRQLKPMVSQVRSILTLAGLNGVTVCSIPEISNNPFDSLSIHTHIQNDRSAAVAHLLSNAKTVAVMPASALRWGLPKPSLFESMTVTLKLGDEIDTADLATKLVKNGYVKRQLVSEPGDFAMRGFVIDLFSPDRGMPCRIELFGDTIESIRDFLPADQRSLTDLDEYSAVPLRSMLLEETNLKAIKSRISGQKHLSSEEKEERYQQITQYEDAAWMWDESESLKTTLSIPKFLHDDSLIILSGEDQIYESLAEQDELWSGLWEINRSGSKGILNALQSSEGVLKDISQRKQLSIRSLIIDSHKEKTEHSKLNLKPLPAAAETKDPFANFIYQMKQLAAKNETALVILQSKGHVERVSDQLRDAGILVYTIADPSQIPNDVAEAIEQKPEGAVIVTVGEIIRGATIVEAGLHIYSQTDLFGEASQRRKRRKSTSSAFISELSELSEGDYVVHEEHGIGKFTGLKTITHGEEVRDFIVLIYRGEDRLMVPIDDMSQVQRYSTQDSIKPMLDKLGGTNWQKVKKRATKAIREMAGELVNLYAIRKTIKGFQHQPDNELIKEFEQSFPHRETVDQLDALEDIKADMESNKPMDRLICGDVGYGKTELAIRATAKACISGRQSAFLAPTTVLAQQHYETIRERFKGFPFSIELLSRYRSAAEQKQIVEKANLGKIDVLIGTHRLLSKDVTFKNLGLLVIDEEQRFGVAHKERIKQMRKSVDVLALSATPIPRTLNMSLAGIRDMSVIQTPPRNRLAIQTKVLPYNKDNIRAAISMELARGGQVFYLRNRVEDIEEVAHMIRKLVPEAKTAIGHAQMSPHKLEAVMKGFVAAETNVLISTTIIENGIDIPNANTLIVERADRFGLSQLYQIRGRVGRSDRSAYAYLLVPPEARMTEDARKRLQAIKEFSELGSGFRIAAMDLEIRGAGNLLGGQQSGHIEAIGFELYNKMLERTVREMKGIEHELSFRAKVNMRIDVHIPEEYIKETTDRMKYYRQVAEAESKLQLEQIREELSDMYGTVPQSVDSFLTHSAIQIKSSAMKIEMVERNEDKLTIKFTTDSLISHLRLAEMVQEGAQFTHSGVLIVDIAGSETFEILKEVDNLLLSLTA
jgi:transcription-repair coupling factor (superfamily II helicase)